MSDSSGGGLVLLGLFGLAIYNCSGDDSDNAESNDVVASAEYAGDYTEAETARRPDFDEDEARDAAKEELSSETYTGIGSPYGCTNDCSGHEAGYAWAADGHDDYGTSRSQSFDEGQRAYEDAVEERVGEMRGEYESGEEPY